MPLTELTIRKAVHGPKPIKLADSGGLFLLLQPSGGKLWRLKYRFGGKEAKLSLGIYPAVSLKEARQRRYDARTKLRHGIDPRAEKRDKVQAVLTDEANKFSTVAEEYFDKMSRDGRAAVTIKKSRWLLSLMAEALGARPVAEITPGELLATIRPVEQEGHLETARRMRSLAGRIFRYAVATSRATSDPSGLLKGALATPKVRHHSAITEPQAVGALLRAIDGFDGHPLTQLALKLTPHVFVRPGELRAAEWAEFDLKRGVWTIPAEKMKMKEAHRVPLSSQALALLRSALVLSAQQQYVFSSLYPADRPMSENTINAALRRLGYTGGEMTAHGFRSTASTLLNESGKWNPDAIERALAHKESNQVRGFYNRAEHWNERVTMAQWWSDYLDELRANQNALKQSAV